MLPQPACRPEAHAYLRAAIGEYNRFGSEGPICEGLDYFQGHCQYPNYAPAYAGVAYSYEMLARSSYEVSPSKAGRCYEALQLDPSLYAHVAASHATTMDCLVPRRIQEALALIRTTLLLTVGMRALGGGLA